MRAETTVDPKREKWMWIIDSYADIAQQVRLFPTHTAVETTHTHASQHGGFDQVWFIRSVVPVFDEGMADQPRLVRKTERATKDVARVSSNCQTTSLRSVKSGGVAGVSGARHG